MYKTLALTLAAVASAMPAPQSGSANGAHPEKSQEFGLVMEVDGSKVALTAVSNGTVGNKVLQAGRLSVYPGSPAYFNSTAGQEYKALNFALDDGVYGIQLPEVEDLAGYAAPATAIYGFQEFEWSTSAGKIDHQRTAALQNFYACKESLPAEQYYLKWGNQDLNGNPPAGCLATSVYQNFNIEGGAKPSPY